MEVRHLDLAARKNLALRLAYFDSVPVGAPIGELSSRIEAIVHAHGSLLEIAGRNAQGKLARLDYDLKQTASEVHRAVQQWIKDSAVLAACFSQFDTAVGAVCCDTCKNAALVRTPLLPCEICHGNKRLDSVVVANAGDCIQQIHALFATAYEIASGYYERAGIPQQELATVFFSTNALAPDDPRENLPPEVHAIGNVDIHMRGSMVELSIQSEAFDRDTYDSLFYILLHECVCHAFQGCVDVTGARAALGNSDSFAEGWMDYIAHLILTQVTSGTGPFGDRWWPRLNGEPVADMGSRIHIYRTGQSRPGLRAQYRKAKSAAAAIRQAFAALLESRSRAEEKLIELSIRMNVLPWTDEVREALSTRILVLDSMNQNRLRDCLGSYLSHGNAQEFSNSVTDFNEYHSSLFI